MKTLKEFDQNMQKEEFRKEFEKKAEVVHEENPDWSELEVISKAAKELGYDMPVELLEKETAEIQELNEEELKQVAGGVGGIDFDGNCRSNWFCTEDWMTEDEHGHDNLCYTAWHCAAVTLHTKSDSKDSYCWKNYQCFVVNK